MRWSAEGAGVAQTSGVRPQDAGTGTYDPVRTGHRSHVDMVGSVTLWAVCPIPLPEAVFRPHRITAPTAAFPPRATRPP
jgi:hypothetical protein